MFVWELRVLEVVLLGHVYESNIIRNNIFKHKPVLHVNWVYAAVVLNREVTSNLECMCNLIVVHTYKNTKLDLSHVKLFNSVIRQYHGWVYNFGFFSEPGTSHGDRRDSLPSTRCLYIFLSSVIQPANILNSAESTTCFHVGGTHSHPTRKKIYNWWIGLHLPGQYVVAPGWCDTGCKGYFGIIWSETSTY